MTAPTTYSEAVARVRLPKPITDAISTYRNALHDLYGEPVTIARANAADAAYGALVAAIHNALPTPEERQQINDAILCVDHVATDPASQRDPYRAHSWQRCAATLRNYLTRTGGPTDGQ